MTAAPQYFLWSPDKQKTALQATSPPWSCLSILPPPSRPMNNSGHVSLVSTDHLPPDPEHNSRRRRRAVLPNKLSPSWRDVQCVFSVDVLV